MAASNFANLEHAYPELASMIREHPNARFYFTGKLWDAYYQPSQVGDHKTKHEHRIGAVVACLMHMDYAHFAPLGHQPYSSSNIGYSRHR